MDTLQKRHFKKYIKGFETDKLKALIEAYNNNIEFDTPMLVPHFMECRKIAIQELLRRRKKILNEKA